MAAYTSYRLVSALPLASRLVAEAVEAVEHVREAAVVELAAAAVAAAAVH